MLQKYLLSTPQNIRRFHALIATPLFMMSALSNFYFFAGMSVGNQFVRRLFEGRSLVRQNHIEMCNFGFWYVAVSYTEVVPTFWCILQS